MNGLEILAVASVAVWLAVLTVVAVLLVRQHGLVALRLDVAFPRVSLDADGPPIGSELADEVRSALPRLNGDATYLLLLSASCTPCREFAAGMADFRSTAPIVALVPGREELADAMTQMLPGDMTVIRDPDAVELAQLLQIESTPFAVQVEHGVVTGKAYVQTVDDLDRLIQSRSQDTRTADSLSGKAVVPSAR